jgi:AraC family transcriptional activator of mtrCDE
MDALSAFLGLYTPGGSLDVRCHVHAPWELDHQPAAPGVATYHVVVEGSADLSVPGHSSLQLEAGDIVVLPRGSAHRLRARHGDAGGRALAPARVEEQDIGAVLRLKTNAGSGPVSDILCGSFVFDQPAGQGLLAALPEVLVVHTAAKPEFAGLQALVAMLRMETEEQRSGAQALIAHLSSVLFGMLMRVWTAGDQVMPGLLGALSSRRLQPALLAMFHDTARNWTLAELARLCHMSRATFTRLFRHATHTTAASVRLQIRMAHAAHALVRDDRPVSAVGDAIGYHSESAFSRVFKKHFGISPREYRCRFRPESGDPRQ